MSTPTITVDLGSAVYVVLGDYVVYLDISIPSDGLIVDAWGLEDAKSRKITIIPNDSGETA